MVTFSEAERKKKLAKLIELLVECENHLNRIFQNLPWKESIKRFLNEKTFGTVEQMRVEMEIRYKAQIVNLTTTDKQKLQGFWVPCI